MKTNEQIIKDINERFFNNDVWLSELRTELSIGDSNFTELRKYILQVRTDTINEIRKEVEKMTFRNKGIEVEINNAKGDKATLRDCVFWEDIKTFLNKLDK